ncbi:unnamed protein product [Didymodactylos carnosus]|uniref:Uncharacterized protein n=1 Tax=Didymodactylos carnosus TaxID=1234261 RepID=A0A815GD36_9BILA|nr:unnamed protein product [Didymodactylos carnosus]CAF1337019.1 unnamed protein product [Didymodactylos carnosus]CAF3770083.1 unnamed protein product [Didymodactylos carnosus]CAF4194760.1 unnamed protein product [Didymodactylos carnosus]
MGTRHTTVTITYRFIAIGFIVPYRLSLLTDTFLMLAEQNQNRESVETKLNLNQLETMEQRTIIYFQTPTQVYSMNNGKINQIQQIPPQLA